MDLISAYSDDDAPSPSGQHGVPVGPLPAVNAAPEVDTTGLVLVNNQAVPLGDALHLQPGNARKVKYNLPIEQMHAPILGPTNPADGNTGIPASMRNHWSGHAEDAHLNSFTFDEQYHTFHSFGHAANPSGSGGVVANRDKSTSAAGPESVFSSAPKRQKTDKKSQKAGAEFNPELGPFVLKTRQPWAEKEIEVPELTEEQKAYIAELKESKAEKTATEGKGETSIFHGNEDKDYQGRSWLDPPADKHKENETCFLPKRHIHTWSGHTKGVNAIRFFPGTGHLLLSAGLDGKIKIWDVFNNKQCMRTYMGHSKGVRDINFSNDGRRFVSTAYDKTVKLWDTETGKVLGKFCEGQMAYTVRIHPDEDKQNILMAGMQNKKIYQLDMNTGEIEQEYDYHLGAINSITFVDQNRRFVSTSDDKTIRVWEYGIPVQVKYIADPSMHAIASVSTTPNGKWWCGQSMDNTILTYSANDRVKPNSKKTFKGHNVAGYACQVNFSHDNHYVISGDGDGKLFIWDWKTTKVLRSIKAHEGVCIGCEWHPLETSKVATCGWDGLIKYWD